MRGVAESLEFLDAANQPGATPHSPESDAWITNNSSFGEYCEPRPGRGIPDLHMTIGKRLLRHVGAVGIDIAGGKDGTALQDLLSVGILSKALLMNYRDRRMPETEDIPNLEHIDGDIISKETWEEMIAWAQENTDGDGPALIMHRPVGALQDLPPETYKGATHLLLDMLRPGGVLLCQVPLGLICEPNNVHLKPIQQSIEQRPDVELVISSAEVFFPRPAVIMKAF